MVGLINYGFWWCLRYESWILERMCRKAAVVVQEMTMAIVLISLGCHNKYHRQGNLNNRNLFLTGLEAGKFKVMAPAHLIWWLVRAHFLVHGTLLCTHKVEEARELFGVPFIRTLISFMSVLPSWPKHLPEAPVPKNTIKLGNRIATMNFGGGGHKYSDQSRKSNGC